MKTRLIILLLLFTTTALFAQNTIVNNVRFGEWSQALSSTRLIAPNRYVKLLQLPI